MKVCALIPAFNEAGSIAGVVEGCKAHAAVVVIDDGSSDDTGRVAEEAGAEVLSMPTNEGKGAALQQGFAHAIAAGCDAVITLDGDGQHDPAEIPSFLAAARDDPVLDMVIGCRMQDPAGMPWLRLMTNRVMSAVVSWLCGQRVLDTQCGYRLMRTRMLRRLSLRATHYDIESELLVQACRSGSKVVEIPVRTIYAGQESKIRVVRETGKFLALVWRHMGQARAAEAN